MTACLYIVSTPIGNLTDITLRAIEILKSVDMIAAEDTRHSQRLLSEYDIRTPCFSLHDHNEDDRIHSILDFLKNGKSIALISDAGTPLISDPGFRVVRAVREANFRVSPIPGACAAIAALTVSGLPTDRFIFEGFLPVKTVALEHYFETIKNETRTIIFYESVHRIVKTVEAMEKVIGANRVAVIAREITKSFETIVQDTLSNLLAFLKNNPVQQKGEFVVILQGDILKENEMSADDEKMKSLLTTLLAELSLKQAVSLACKLTNANRKKIYALALTLKNVDSES